MSFLINPQEVSDASLPGNNFINYHQSKEQDVERRQLNWISKWNGLIWYFDHTMRPCSNNFRMFSLKIKLTKVLDLVLVDTGFIRIWLVVVKWSLSGKSLLQLYLSSTTAFTMILKKIYPWSLKCCFKFFDVVTTNVSEFSSNSNKANNGNWISLQNVLIQFQFGTYHQKVKDIVK